MENHSRSLDEQVRKAIEDGLFDDLPGKGKPIDLNENPFEDPSWRLANRMLRASGFSLPWIETRKEIEADYWEVVGELQRTWQWRLTKGDQGYLDSVVESEWTRALEVFKSKVFDLNKRIFNYNLEAPLDQFKLRTINIEREIARISSASD